MRKVLGRGREADEWFRQALRGKAVDTRGQSTVEYALVSVAFIAMVVGLGALSNAVQSGELIEHAVAAASHGVQAALGGVTDVFSY